MNGPEQTPEASAPQPVAPSANPAAPSPLPRRRLVLVAASAALLAAGTALALVALLRDGPLPDETSADPRLQYSGPFQNVHPSAAYVSDRRCGDCHVDIARNYAQ